MLEQTTAPAPVLDQARITTHEGLTAFDIAMIAQSLTSSMNREGQTLDDFKSAVFVFYKTIFLILNTYDLPTGRELFVSWMGGTHFITHKHDVWKLLQELARNGGCRFIGAVCRKRSLQRMYQSIGVKLDMCFMHELEQSNG